MRIFEEGNWTTDKCPVCGTDKEGPVVLISIKGTNEGYISEAKLLSEEIYELAKKEALASGKKFVVPSDILTEDYIETYEEFKQFPWYKNKSDEELKRLYKSYLIIMGFKNMGFIEKIHCEQCEKQISNENQIFNKDEKGIKYTICPLCNEKIKEDKE